MDSDPMQKVYKGLGAAVAAAIVLGMGYWMNSPGGGPEELARAQKALMDVKSWRIVYVSQRANEDDFQVEVSCPNAHMVRRKKNPKPTDRGVYRELLVAGNDKYVRESPEEAWKTTDDAWAIEYLCTQTQQGNGNPMYMPALQLLLEGRRIQIEKGEKKNVDGTECRVWKAKHILKFEESLNEEVCLGTKDHLPYERVTSSGRFTFKGWNMPIKISAPL